MRFVVSLLFAGILLFTSAASAGKQTLSLRAGEKTLFFEAPEGQCFVDRSSPAGEQIFKSLGMHHGQHADKRLLAVMIGCGAITDESVAQGLDTILLNTTRIYWLNADFGDTVQTMSRYQFFTEYEKYVKKDGLMDAQEFRRSKHYTSTHAQDVLKTKFGQTGMFTTRSGLTIKDVPLEIISRSSTKYVNLDQKYAELDNLINLQIQINE